jgi:hypothetical protein
MTCSSSHSYCPCFVCRIALFLRQNSGAIVLGILLGLLITIYRVDQRTNFIELLLL